MIHKARTLVARSTLAIACIIIVNVSANLDVQAAPFEPTMPEDLDQVDFYLHTIDLGWLIHEKYGHTQIRVHDRRSGLDVAYSWGIFDYRDPNFALNFYKGLMTYSIGAYAIRTAHRIYQAEGRTVWEDHINLSKAQKQRIMEKIIHDMRPEHRSYSYQYFFDNCSTRPRDFIDHAIAGALRRHADGQMASRSFREVVRTYQATTPFTSIGLEVTMNSNLDRLMTLWEEMFLPASLRDRLLEMSLVDDSGQQTGAGKLLTPVRAYYRTDTPHADWWRDDIGTLLFLFVLPLCLLLGARKTQSSLPLRLYGLLLVIWGVFSGFVGALMPLSWAVSQHLDLHHNANMWLFWPVDLLAAFVGYQFLRFGGNARFSALLVRLYRPLTMLHIGGWGVLLIGNITGLVDQNSLRILFTFGISMILLQLTSLRLINMRAAGQDA